MFYFSTLCLTRHGLRPIVNGNYLKFPGIPSPQVEASLTGQSLPSLSSRTRTVCAQTSQCSSLLPDTYSPRDFLLRRDPNPTLVLLWQHEYSSPDPHCLCACMPICFLPSLTAQTGFPHTAGKLICYAGLRTGVWLWCGCAPITVVFSVCMCGVGWDAESGGSLGPGLVRVLVSRKDRE